MRAAAPDRPTLALLPGLLCDRTVWAAQAEALRERFEVVVPDWGELDSLPAMAGRLLVEVAAPTFSLAGHSMGGRVALEVMRRAPGRVERLALLDTGYKPLAPGGEGELERAGRMALLEVAHRQGMRAMAAQWARGMVHPRRLGTPLFEAIVQMIGRSTPDVFEAQIHALLARPDSTALLRDIACPTVVLVGRDDAWSRLPQHQAMHEAIAGSVLHVIDDCGHMSPMEQPAAVTAVLRGWLDASA